MKVVMNYPPNIDEIKKHFKVNQGTVYTYGNTLYSPLKAYIDKDLMVHEETHARQQTDPKAWWAKYFIDSDFRIAQEAEAYRNQLMEFMKTAKTRELVDAFLVKIAQDLSGPMYGNALTYEQAVEKITEGGDSNVMVSKEMPKM